jgi:2-polyprenyl-6-methoxyphenol hydroxylase-like FAD-dependent oxidoreductase
LSPITDATVVEGEMGGGPGGSVSGRVGIVGGSIAGCAAAIAARNAGLDVTIFERSRGGLHGRGVGINVLEDPYAELVKSGYFDPDIPVFTITERRWLFRDDSPTGRVLWRQPLALKSCNWANLWLGVRARVPEGVYHEGAEITAIEPGADGVTVVSADGHRHRFDAVIGADGYRSAVRNAVFPGLRADYAGYVVWRGSYPARRLAGAGLSPEIFRRALTSVCYQDGHGVFYLIPETAWEPGRPARGPVEPADGTVGNSAGRPPGEPAAERVNWAIYAAMPARDDFADPTTIPPGKVTAELRAYLDDLLDRHFPAAWAQVARLSAVEEIFIQPIYDLTIPNYAAGRVAFVGDSGTVLRPHTSSGATKALEDSIAFERACRGHDAWDRALSAYDDDRRSIGAWMMDIGRRLGHHQVERTPDWGSMSAEQMTAWWTDIFTGAPPGSVKIPGT